MAHTKTQAESLGQRLALAMKRGREGRRVTNAQLAAAAGVSTTTVSAWLNDRGPEGPKRDTLQKAADFLGVSAAWLEHGDEPLAVREPAPPFALPRPLQIVAAEYELEALKAGADEEDMQYIRTALRSPEAMQLYRGGYAEALSIDEQRVEMDSLIEMLRVWLTERIRRRKAAQRRS